MRLEPLEGFVAINEPGAEPIVGGSDLVAIPQDGDVMIYGSGGAAKTTFAVDLAFHLASGEEWLGIPIPSAVRVLIVENEGPRPLFRRKLDRKLTGWQGPTTAGRLLVLDEPWGRVDLTHPDCRQALADKLASNEIDVVVIGPVTRIGMNEAGTLQEVRDFMRMVDDTRDRADRPVTFVLVHHENKGGTVSGAWEGATDTLIHMTAQGHGRTRVYWEKARWASELHETTMHLAWAEGETFTLEEREEVTDAVMIDRLLTAVREAAGNSWTNIRSNVKGCNGTALMAVRDRLLIEGQLVNAATAEGQFKLWAADDPARPRSDSGTASERLTVHLSPETPAPDRSPFPRIEGPGTERNGSDDNLNAQDAVRRLRATATIAEQLGTQEGADLGAGIRQAAFRLDHLAGRLHTTGGYRPEVPATTPAVRAPFVAASTPQGSNA